MQKETKKHRKTISWSAVQAYMQCPLRYKFNYVDKIEPQITTDSLLLGSTIHRALENYMVVLKKENRRMECKEFNKSFESIFIEATKDKQVRYSEGWDQVRLIRMGKNMLAFWMQGFTKYLKCASEVIAIEHRFEINTTNPESGLPLSRTITGTIDLILKLNTSKSNTYFRGPGGSNSKATYLLLDHKTASQRYPEIKVHRDMQLSLYQWAAVKSGLIPDREKALVGFSVLYKKIRPEFELELSRRSAEQELQTLRTVSAIVDAIDLELFYPINYNPMACRNCPYIGEECDNW